MSIGHMQIMKLDRPELVGSELLSFWFVRSWALFWPSAQVFKSRLQPMEQKPPIFSVALKESNIDLVSSRAR